MNSMSLRWAERSSGWFRGTTRRAMSRRSFVLEQLEARIALSALVNGDFSISDPSDPNYGWTTRGHASIANGEGILNEGTTVQTEFSQSFTIAPGTTTLALHDRGFEPGEQRRREPARCLRGGALGLADEPAAGRAGDRPLEHRRVSEHPADRRGLLRARRSRCPEPGRRARSPRSRYPEQVTVDVSSVPANTQATLYFDLIGFSPATSVVRIDAVTTLRGLPLRRSRSRSIRRPTRESSATTSRTSTREPDRCDRSEPDRLARHSARRVHRRHDDGRRQRPLHVHAASRWPKGPTSSASRPPTPRAAPSPARRSRLTTSRRPVPW